MIHPSTMAGPSWFTGSFSTTNPFQQTSPTFFRNTPFQTPQGGFGSGNTQFQNPSFGYGGSMPFQNTINEIVRQTVPTALASYGIPTSSFQTSFGTPGTFGFQNPWSFQASTGSAQFGTSFQNYDWLNPGFFSEIIRQATNQAIQNTWQINPSGFTTFASSPTTPTFGFGTTGQTQDLTNFIGQICLQACQQACTTLCQAVATCVNECLNNTQNTSQNTGFGTPMAFGTNWQQQNLGNFCAQICQQACQSMCQTLCQAVITCMSECINTQNRSQSFSFSTPTGFGQNSQQQNFWNFCTQICQQACQSISQTLSQAVAICVNECFNQQNRMQSSSFGTPTTFGTNWQPQNLGNFIGQICQQACQQACTTLVQAVTTCVNEGISLQNRSTNTSFFNTPNNSYRASGTPFNANATSQYGFTSGIPTGAGAF